MVCSGISFLDPSDCDPVDGSFCAAADILAPGAVRPGENAEGQNDFAAGSRRYGGRLVWFPVRNRFGG